MADRGGANEGDVLTWQETGLRASADRRDEIARRLEAGIVPPPDVPVP